LKYYKIGEKMSKIAVIITDMFEDSEYTEPATAFKNAGHDLVHIEFEEGKTVKGKKKGTPVTIDKAVSEVSIQDFDALLIPGGYSPDKLRVDEEAVSNYSRCPERAEDHRLEIHSTGHKERRSRVH
jgi:protease I